MFLIAHSAQSYASFLQDALMTGDDWYLSFVLIRFYFLWHKNDRIASGVRQWCKNVTCGPARDLLLQITAHTVGYTDAAAPKDWFVSQYTVVEDHVVPSLADMRSLTRDESMESFVKQLFYAEWLDLCQCIYWDSDTQNNLLVGVYRDD